ncbi:hypothetical protein TSUD_59160 [Trifolium subterraneum]|uniref:RNase H type-1 domain-containing protein n=1 Tax=Trifolium subterraneum TaxID=3900 RepID=A0A2Z6M917_TRISU|nr:hypothetical protein TSUD_59160 [Trifolium subterraneum]
MAEIWGLYEGLCLARNLGITRLEVQVDSEALVKAIQGSNVGGNMYWNIMKKIQELLNLDWEIRLTHIYRDANRCTDILANMGSNLAANKIIYEEPPLEVRQVLSMILGVFPYPV